MRRICWHCQKRGKRWLAPKEKFLNEKFPDVKGQLNKTEMAEYCAFKATLPHELRGSLEKTDTLVAQLCALQYIPRNPRITIVSYLISSNTRPTTNATTSQLIAPKIQYRNDQTLPVSRWNMNLIGFSSGHRVRR
jgi:hypothetical protein